MGSLYLSLSPHLHNRTQNSLLGYLPDDRNNNSEEQYIEVRVVQDHYIDSHHAT